MFHICPDGNGNVSARLRALGSIEERELFTLYRRRTGVKQVDVARRSGVVQSKISSWETGKLRFRPERVERLWAAAEELARELSGAGDDSESVA